jgi:hypothetical protein
LGERYVRNVEVGGSNPPISTRNYKGDLKRVNAPKWRNGRSPAENEPAFFQGELREKKESPHLHQKL